MHAWQSMFNVLVHPNMKFQNFISQGNGGNGYKWIRGNDPVNGYCAIRLFFSHLIKSVSAFFLLSVVKINSLQRKNNFLEKRNIKL